MTEISSVTPDLQASTPEVRLSLTRAGVTGVQKAVRVSHEGHQTVMAAEIECTVDLAGAEGRAHVALPELFEEAIEAVVGSEALTSSRLPSTSPSTSSAARARFAPRRGSRALAGARQDAGEQALDAGDGLAVGIAAATRRVAASSESKRPGSMLPVRAGARSRPGRRAPRRGRADEDVDRILDLVPLATHNQRGKGTLYVGTERSWTQTPGRDRPGVDERAVYELLKRPDELFVVEHAHLQPRFVEDSVRIALASDTTRFPDLDDTDFLYSRQVNLETIHSHDVLAERYGTVGELRSELTDGTQPRRHTKLDDWLRTR